MTPKNVTDPTIALRLIEEFKTKSTLSNCFLMSTELERLIRKECLWYVINGRNAFFLEDKGNCFRIHYMINDERRDFPWVTDKPLMLEILFRGKDGEPEQVITYWENQKFSRNLVRNNLTARYADLILSPCDKNSDIHIAQNEAECRFAELLFKDFFDPYSGDYIDSDEFEALFRDRKILIASCDGNSCGALHFYNVGRCAWIGHVAVTPDARGRGLGPALIREFIRLNYVDDKSRYALWVQSQNQAANAMYERFGFKYADKSSLSMIKETY